MKTRQELYSQVAPYDDRLTAWQAAIDAAKKQIQLAQATQEAGVRIIRQIQGIDPEAQVDPDKLVRLHQQCLSNVEKGSKLERDARQEVMRLQHIQPKQK